MADCGSLQFPAATESVREVSLGTMKEQDCPMPLCQAGEETGDVPCLAALSFAQSFKNRGRAELSCPAKVHVFACSTEDPSSIFNNVPHSVHYPQACCTSQSFALRMAYHLLPVVVFSRINIRC